MTEAMMEKEIDSRRQRNVRQLERELAENGSYEQWYAELEEFRNSLSKFYKYSLGGGGGRRKEKFNAICVRDQRMRL